MFFAHVCDGCGERGRGTCDACMRRLLSEARPTGSAIWAGFVFSGMARELIIGLKYRNHRANARVLVDAVLQRLHPLPPVDVITWVPTTRLRQRQRGVDQSELLARRFGRHLRVPVRRLLHKTSDEVQTGRTRRQRLQGPTFVARPVGAATRVMVVDDVVTTGASFDRARAVLIAAGATSVVCVAVAATPAPMNTR